MADKHEQAATPLGLEVIGGFTQGSSFVATLWALGQNPFGIRTGNI